MKEFSEQVYEKWSSFKIKFDGDSPTYLILSNMTWMKLRKENMEGHSHLYRDHKKQQWMYMDMKIAILMETDHTDMTMEVK